VSHGVRNNMKKMQTISLNANPLSAGVGKPADILERELLEQEIREEREYRMRSCPKKIYNCEVCC